MKNYVDKDKLQEYTTKLNAKMKTIFATKSEVGSPLKASTVAEMTDESRIYVYTGSESGYTAGNWYYYDGSAWTSGGVYNSTAFETDATLAVPGMAADAKAAGDAIGKVEGDITDLKTQLNDVAENVTDIIGIEGEEITDLSGYERYYGIINSSNVWANLNDRYQYIVIPITNIGATISASAAIGGGFQIAGLRSYTAPTKDGDVPDFSTVTGWTGRITVGENTPLSSKPIPDDVKYLLVFVMSAGSDKTPANFDLIIPGKTGIIDNLENDISQNASDISNAYQASKFALVDDDYILFTGKIIPGKRYNTTGNIVDSVNAAIIEKFTATHDIIFSRTVDITIERKVVFGDGDTKTVVSNDGTEEFYTVLKGQTVGFSLFKNGVTVTQDYVVENVSAKLKSSIYWVALGDSITHGVYTYIDENQEVQSATVPQKSYCAEIQRITGWNWTDKGVGGIGWMMTESASGNSKNVTDVIQEIDFTKYNLCTIALGVNDWKGNQPFGTLEDTTVNTSVYANMKYTIEYILAHNPNINITIITPLNCAVYTSSTEAENWGIGHANSNGKTLEDLFDLIVDVCNYYGIKYVDNTHYSTVNRKNIKEILLDNVHPSEEGHRLIGQRLAWEI